MPKRILSMNFLDQLQNMLPIHYVPHIIFSLLREFKLLALY